MSILSNNNRIALLFLVFAAATGPVSGTRNLKSSKDDGDDGSRKRGPTWSKHPKGQCVEVFTIDGPIEAHGFSGIITECCIKESDYMQCGADLAVVPPTLDLFDEDCVADYLLTYPFLHTFGGLTDSFKFTEDDAFTGKGSFKGTVSDSTTDFYKSEKIILGYNSMEYNGKNDELWGRSVADLEYIEYSFKAESCGLADPNPANSPCPGKFYLNVFTRVNTESNNYYDCSYDFAPTTGGIEGLPKNNGWTTVRFDIDTPATNTKTFPYYLLDPVDLSLYRSGCPADGVTPPTANDPLNVAGEADYVLGTNEQLASGSGIGQIFALNMGDTTLSDAGLAGYFDRVVIKMVGENPRTYDLEPETAI